MKLFVLILLVTISAVGAYSPLLTASLTSIKQEYGAAHVHACNTPHHTTAYLGASILQLFQEAHATGKEPDKSLLGKLLIHLETLHQQELHLLAHDAKASVRKNSDAVSLLALYVEEEKNKIEEIFKDHYVLGDFICSSIKTIKGNLDRILAHIEAELRNEQVAACIKTGHVQPIVTLLQELSDETPVFNRVHRLKSINALSRAQHTLQKKVDEACLEFPDAVWVSGSDDDNDDESDGVLVDKEDLE